MKIINIDTKLRWTILEPKNKEDLFVAVCDRLGISIQASTLDQLETDINDATNVLFQDLYDTGDLNKYCFDHSIAYKIEDYNRYLEILPPPIIIDYNK